MNQYDFRTLSPLDFEELARDVLQAEFGLLFESFSPGRDLGIDFRFASAQGTVVVQAKHYVESGFDALLAAAKLEEPKVAKLKPARYILVTSVSLTEGKKAKLKAALPSAPLATGDIFGREGLNNLLGRHPNVERRHFKLWMASTTVLERIVHSGIYNRTQAEMDEIRSTIPKFVQNESLPQAHAILENTGALIIAGQPGVGKTTLARMLIWMHIQDDWNVSVIDNITDAFTLAHDGERRLVFFDDFLGQVRLTADWLRTVDQRLPPFLQKARSTKTLRFIMTTRDYLLHQAQAQSDRLADAPVRLSEFVLNVGAYTREIRARILYNHIHFSTLAPSDRRALLDDDFFLTIINHRNFNPRIVGQFTSADFVSLLDGPIKTSFTAVLESPDVLWEKPYRHHITDDGRSLMTALFFSANRVSLTHLEDAFERVSLALERPMPRVELPARFRSAVKELEGSVLSIESHVVTFSNPGVRDFLQRIAEQDRVFPAIARVVNRFSELEQCWTAWRAQSEISDTSAMIPLWVAAARRVVAHDNPNALYYLRLVLEFIDDLPADEIVEIAEEAIDNLRDAEFDGDEADDIMKLFEALSSTTLPLSLANEAKRLLASATARMLREYGSVLSLDTIESVGESLQSHGPDENLAISASKAALKGYLAELNNTLSDITSVDDLDQLERHLNRMLEDYGVDSPRASDRIQDRREELEGQIPDSYRSLERPSIIWRGPISDDEIRSLFYSLRQ